MTPEKPNDSRTFIVQQIESLDSAALANWMRARLHNRDRLVVTRDREPAYYLVANIYGFLERDIQADLSRIALHMLSEIEKRTWDTAPAAALLRLVDPLLMAPHHRQATIDVLQRIVQSRPPKDEIAFAAVQGLVALEHRATPRFWSNLLKRDERYAPTIFEAMARTLFGSLQEWLLRTLPHEEVEKAVVNALPFLVEDHGGDKLMSLLIAIEPHLTDPAKEQIKAFAAREQLTPALPSEDLLRGHLVRLLRCVDTMLWSETSEPNDETAMAFARYALIYRQELRRRRDAQSVVDKSLTSDWEIYVGILEHALARGDAFRTRAQSELLASLLQVRAKNVVDAINNYVQMHRGDTPIRFTVELRQRIVTALLLTREMRDVRNEYIRSNRSLGPGDSVMAILRDLQQ